MTFPTKVAQTSGFGATVTLPPTILANDLLLIYYSAAGVPSWVWDQSTAGTWSLIAGGGSGDNGSRLGVYLKTADGSEDGKSLAITGLSGANASWQVFQYRGANNVWVGANVQGHDNPSSGPHPNSPTLSPSGGAQDFTWVSVATQPFQGSTNTPPTSYTGSSKVNSTSPGVCQWLAYRNLNAATEDPGAWTCPEADWIACTLAIGTSTDQTLSPGALTSSFDLQAPTITTQNDLLAPALTMSFDLQAPIVGLEQILLPGALTSTFAIQAPQIVTGIGPPALAMDFTLQLPTVISALQIAQPPALTMDFSLPKATVIGGTRTAPTFTHVSIGPSPGAVSDLAIYSDPARAQIFDQIWEIRGPIGFKNFAPFLSGEYNFSDAKVWLRLEIPDAQTNIFGITRDKVNVDVPDVVDSATVAVASGGQLISFGRTFYAIPKVVANVVTANGVNTVPRCTVRNDVSKTQFFVTIHYGDDLTNTLAGTVHYVASGY